MSTKVLITGKLHPSAIEAFKHDSNIDLIYKADSNFEAYKSDLKDAEVIITRSETTIDRRLIDHAPNLRIIARAAVGVGNIDLDYATEKGILVMNTPGKNTNSAAEMTLCLLLAMMRKLPESQLKVKAGGWDRHMYTGSELRDKKVGLVGLGHVGHRVAKFLLGFDADVYAYDPYIASEKFDRYGVKKVESLKELAEISDILSVHVPKNKETTGMVTKDILRALGEKGLFVNAARGGIGDEKAILEALNEGLIAGAAIDTFDNEPAPMQELVEHEKVWCSPHIGASTIEAQFAIGQTVVEQVRKAIEGLVVDYHVNLPEMGVIESPSLKAYTTLASKLGSILGQILDFNPREIDILYRGELAATDNSVIKLSLLKAYASHVVDGYVSYVNVGKHIEDMGIGVKEGKDSSFDSYNSAIKVVVKGAEGRELSLGGVVFDSRYPRLTLINDFYFEIEPSGHLLLLKNHDKPGVIGDVGHYLAAINKNISSFSLSRNSKGEKAMAVIRLDSTLNEDQFKGLKVIKNVISVDKVEI